MEKNITLDSKQKFQIRIKELIIAIFLVFVFFVLSLGRAFSLFHIGPVYITEIVLFLSLFLFFCEKKVFLQIPPVLLISISAYFIFSFLYLLSGLLKNNLFALRDIVLSYYLLFFPIVFIIFSEKNKLKLFLITLFFGNIAGFILGRLLLYRSFELPQWLWFITQIKGFNYALYYGISMSFLISFFNFTKQMIYKFCIMLLLVLNLYMLIVWGIRTAWISCIILALFLFMLTSWKEKVRLIIYFIPIFFIAVAINLTYSLDSEGIRKAVISAKLPSMQLFLKTALNKKKEPLLSEKVSFSQQIPNTKHENLNFYEKEKMLREEEFVLQDKFYKPKEAFPRSHVILVNVLASKLPQEYKDTFANIQWRLGVWDIALNFGLEHPILGGGFGIYPIMIPPPVTFRANSGIKPVHNHIITVFYKMGIVGLGLFLFINIYSFLYGLAYLKRCNTAFCKYFLIGSLGSLVFWHAMAFFFDVIDSPPTNIFLWIILGLIFACVQADRKEES